MYTEPDLLPQLKPDITFGKVVATIITLVLFLALPIGIIDTYIQPDNPQPQPVSTSSTGQVAGVSTSSNSEDVITIPVIEYDLELESQGGLLILAGSVLIGIAIVMLMYVLVVEQKVKR